MKNTGPPLLNLIAGPIKPCHPNLPAAYMVPNTGYKACIPNDPGCHNTGPG